MRYLKQSTSVDVGIGPFLDETDGKTAETALTITQPDVRLKKNGGAWAQKAAAQTLSHEEAGWYEVTLDATDTDTIGILLVAVHESGALPVWMEFHVLAANVYDSLFGSGDVLDVSVTQFAGSAITAAAGIPEVKVASIAANAITAAAVADGAIDAATFAAGAITATVLANDCITDAKVASDVTIASVTGAVGSVTGAVGSVTGNVGGNVVGSVASVAGSVGGNLAGSVLGSVAGSVGSVTGAVGSVTGAVGSVTGAVGSVTGSVGGNVTGSVGSLATQAKADVNAEVLDVLNTDTFAEPGQEAPAATNTLVKKIGYLFKFLRNKVTQTSTTLSVFADDATTVDQKSTVSDDGTTYTRGEIASGP